MLEMAKLAPILKEVPKGIRVGSHDRSGSHDWQLHQTLPFHAGVYEIGSESSIGKPEMAKHNSRV